MDPEVQHVLLIAFLNSDNVFLGETFLRPLSTVCDVSVYCTTLTVNSCHTFWTIQGLFFFNMTLKKVKILTFSLTLIHIKHKKRKHQSISIVKQTILVLESSFSNLFHKSNFFDLLLLLLLFNIFIRNLFLLGLGCSNSTTINVVINNIFGSHILNDVSVCVFYYSSVLFPS